MIDPKAITTYAQYNEDIILLALLSSYKKGFYIDVGANYATIDSVTKLFYDKGWHGINIEPIKNLHTELSKERPRDINLQCGLGEKPGKGLFREFLDAHGHSTFSDLEKSSQKSKAHRDYEVEIKTLAQVFNEHVKGQEVHFLKIDVEGFEYEVIQGNNWTNYRPKVLCIEANHMGKDWRPILKSNKYKLFISDGINTYYIAEEAWKLTDGFDELIVDLDYRSLKQHQSQSWSEDSKQLLKLSELVQRQDGIIQDLKQQVKNLDRLSLHNKSLKTRARISAYGLTKDYIDFKKPKR